MLQCGWTLRTLLRERNQTKRSHLYKTFRRSKFIETVKTDVCQGLGDGSDCLMGTGFPSGWWKSSGTGRRNGCSILLNVLHAAELFSEMVNFRWISPPPPTKNTAHTQDSILHHLKQKASQGVWMTLNLVSTPLYTGALGHSAKPCGLEQVSSTLQTSGVSFPCMKRRPLTGLLWGSTEIMTIKILSKVLLLLLLSRFSRVQLCATP